jgi:hypothetical protein
VEKIDLKKALKHLYQTSAKEVVQVEIPTFKLGVPLGSAVPDLLTVSDAILAQFP